VLDELDVAQSVHPAGHRGLDSVFERASGLLDEHVSAPRSCEPGRLDLPPGTRIRIDPVRLVGARCFNRPLVPRRRPDPGRKPVGRIARVVAQAETSYGKLIEMCAPRLPRRCQGIMTKRAILFGAVS